MTRQVRRTLTVVGERRAPQRNGRLLGVGPEAPATYTPRFVSLTAGSQLGPYGIDPAKNFQGTVITPLFEAEITDTGAHPHVVTRDGKRFLIPVSDQPPHK